MSVYGVINLINIAVWLLPPFRNRGGRYFNYFLVLALTDPLKRLLQQFVFVELNIWYVIAAFILYLVLNPGIKKWAALAVICAAMLFYSFSALMMNLALLLIHIFVLAEIVKKEFSVMAQQQALNVFFGVLFFYELTVIFKIWFYTVNLSYGVVYYILFNCINILIAIYFTFFSYGSSPKIKFMKEQKMNILS